MTSLPNPTAARILFLNVGYCTGLEGGTTEYLLNWYRYLYTSRRTMENVLHDLHLMIEQESPDICCFLEIHKTSGLLQNMHAYPYFDIENKYGLHALLRHLPLFRKNCNGVFSRKPLQMQKHFLNAGRKKLVYEVTLENGASLFVSHLSLTHGARSRQIAELADLVRNKKNVILCGDFNAFRGRKEISELEACGLHLVNPPLKGTFPSIHPRITLDMFLCSPDVDIEQVRVLQDVKLSDHLPVVLDIRL